MSLYLLLGIGGDDVKRGPPPLPPPSAPGFEIAHRYSSYSMDTSGGKVTLWEDLEADSDLGSLDLPPVLELPDVGGTDARHNATVNFTSVIQAMQAVATAANISQPVTYVAIYKNLKTPPDKTSAAPPSPNTATFMEGDVGSAKVKVGGKWEDTDIFGGEPTVPRRFTLSAGADAPADSKISPGHHVSIWVFDGASSLMYQDTHPSSTVNPSTDAFFGLLELIDLEIEYQEVLIYDGKPTVVDVENLQEFASEHYHAHPPLARIVHRYDANHGVAVDGSNNLLTWDDTSGDADLKQDDSAHRPKLIPAAFSKHTAGVHFDGTQWTEQSKDASSPLITQPYTVAIIYKNWLPAQFQRGVVISGSHAVGSQVRIFDSHPTGKVDEIYAFAGTAEVDTAIEIKSDTNAHTAVIVFDGADSVAYHDAIHGHGTFDPGAQALGTILLGADSELGNDPANLVLGLLTVYEGAMTEERVIKLQEYAERRYGAPAPPTHSAPRLPTALTVDPSQRWVAGHNETQGTGGVEEWQDIIDSVVLRQISATRRPHDDPGSFDAGRPGLEFKRAADTDFMEAAASAFPDQPFSAFVIMKGRVVDPLTPQDQGIMASLPTSANTGWVTVHPQTGIVQMAAGTKVDMGVSVPAVTPFSLLAVFDGAASKAYVDGVGGPAANPGALGLDSKGLRFMGTSDLFGDGVVAEFILFQGALTAADATLLHTWAEANYIP